MRIDKYIWAVRLKKTRSIASYDCSGDKVKLNGDFAKPGKIVRVGDVIEIKHNPVWLKYEILDLPKSRVGAKLVDQLIRDLSDPKDLEMLRHIQLTNRQNKLMGIKGRPTKKDRRDLDDLLD